MDLVYIGSDGLEGHIGSVADLAQAVHDGEITDTTLVRRGNSGRWEPAQGLPEYQRARDLVEVAQDAAQSSGVSVVEEARSRPAPFMAHQPRPLPEEPTLRAEPRVSGEPPPRLEPRFDAAEEPDEDQNEVWRPVVPGAARLARKPVYAFWVFLAGFAVLLGANIYGLWWVNGMRDVVLLYGWGRVPSAAFPATPELYDQIVTWLSTVGGITIPIAFLVTMAYLRNALDEFGVTGMQYRYKTTVISGFIPLWNLYRPWVGFSEIRRAAIGCARRGKVGNDWVDDGGAWMTFLFAITYIGMQLVGTAAERGLKDTPAPTSLSSFLDFVARFNALVGIESAAVLIFGAVALLYLRPALKAVETLAARTVERR